MSLGVNLHTDLVSVIPNNRESLIEGLRSIAEFDNDFNGYNGTKSQVLAKFDAGLNSDIENVLHFLKDGELPHTQVDGASIQQFTRLSYKKL